MTVYPVREDTLLVKRNLKEENLEGKKFLEMGVGNGEITLTAARKEAEVTGVDINPEAVNHTEERLEDQDQDAEILQSDLFQEVEGKFDLIVFNPPYLPGEKEIGDEEMWRGGEKGLETSRKYLKQVKNYLKAEGEAWIVLSSKTEHQKLVKKNNMEKKDSLKLWFETLKLHKIR
jgi:release factor glutamine methyltransferase